MLWCQCHRCNVLHLSKDKPAAHLKWHLHSSYQTEEMTSFLLLYLLNVPLFSSVMTFCSLLMSVKVTYAILLSRLCKISVTNVQLATDKSFSTDKQRNGNRCQPERAIIITLILRVPLVTSSRENMELFHFFPVEIHDSNTLKIMPEDQRHFHQTSKQEDPHQSGTDTMEKLWDIWRQSSPTDMDVWQDDWSLQTPDIFLHRARSGRESHAQINKETRPLFFPKSKFGFSPSENIMAAITT